MKLAQAICHYHIFGANFVDIYVVRTNKKTNTQYMFVIAMIRNKGHLYVEYKMQDLFEKLQDRTCEIYSEASSRIIRIIVKE